MPNLWTRRKLIGTVALALTPKQTEGPFYPDRLPLDTDNDLPVINDGITASIGEVAHLSGRLLNASGSPIRNAVVEIWQVDGYGVYLHTGSNGKAWRNAKFQGFGRLSTTSVSPFLAVWPSFRAWRSG